MSEELKACPFCGKTGADEDGPSPNWGIREGRGEVMFVVCCMVQTDDYPSYEEAIAAWNRRTPSEPVSRGAERRESIEDPETVADILGRARAMRTDHEIDALQVLLMDVSEGAAEASRKPSSDGDYEFSCISLALTAKNAALTIQALRTPGSARKSAPARTGAPAEADAPVATASEREARSGASPPSAELWLAGSGTSPSILVPSTLSVEARSSSMATSTGNSTMTFIGPEPDIQKDAVSEAERAFMHDVKVTPLFAAPATQEAPMDPADHNSALADAIDAGHRPTSPSAPAEPLEALERQIAFMEERAAKFRRLVSNLDGDENIVPRETARLRADDLESHARSLRAALSVSTSAPK